MDKDAHAVAAHFRAGAVAVVVVHEPLGVGVLRQQCGALADVLGTHGADQSVAANPAVAVAQGRNLLRRKFVHAVGIGHQHKVVAGSMAFGKAHACQGSGGFSHG